MTTCIFSINTGRSGSNYLQTIFSYVPNCQSFHEPEPRGKGVAMHQFALGNPEMMQEIARIKADCIAELARDGRVYVETNHCFIKGFGWFIPQYFPEDNIGVVILKRDEEKIVNSMLRIDCTALTSFGREWSSRPDKKNPLVPPPAVLGAPLLTYYGVRALVKVRRILSERGWLDPAEKPRWIADYERECTRWYVRETCAQAEAYKRCFPNIKYYEVDVNDLNSPDRVRDMLHYFGLEWNEALNEAIGKPTNLKTEKKSKLRLLHSR